MVFILPLYFKQLCCILFGWRYLLFNSWYGLLYELYFSWYGYSNYSRYAPIKL